jgi:hypothetical protein
MQDHILEILSKNKYFLFSKIKSICSKNIINKSEKILKKRKKEIDTKQYPYSSSSNNPV